MMDESIVQVSKMLGSGHKGIKILRKMKKLVKKAIDNGSIVRLPDAEISGTPGDSSKGDVIPPTSKGVKFKTKETNANGTYEFYTANSRNEAIDFLRKMPVKDEKKNILVETPEGNFGKDLIAIFHEAKSNIIEYGQRQPLPQLIKSMTRCAKCGYPVLPADPAVDESVERILLEQAKPQTGILALKKEGASEGLLLEQLKKHGVGFFCSTCPTAWCPFCVNPITPTSCGICSSDMALHRKK